MAKKRKASIELGGGYPSPSFDSKNEWAQGGRSTSNDLFIERIFELKQLLLGCLVLCFWLEAEKPNDKWIWSSSNIQFVSTHTRRTTPQLTIGVIRFQSNNKIMPPREVEHDGDVVMRIQMLALTSIFKSNWWIFAMLLAVRRTVRIYSIIGWRKIVPMMKLRLRRGHSAWNKLRNLRAKHVRLVQEEEETAAARLTQEEEERRRRDEEERNRAEETARLDSRSRRDRSSRSRGRIG